LFRRIFFFQTTTKKFLAGRKFTEQKSFLAYTVRKNFCWHGGKGTWRKFFTSTAILQEIFRHGDGKVWFSICDFINF
jgi:hypothetical protein